MCFALLMPVLTACDGFVQFFNIMFCQWLDGAAGLEGILNDHKGRSTCISRRNFESGGIKQLTVLMPQDDGLES